MKKPLTLLMSNGLIATYSVVACFLAVTSTNAAPLISARVTQIIQDVKLLPSNAAPRPAAVNDDVHQGTAVRTGQDSRTELTFTDKTLTRLGANSVFSFDSGAGIFNLGQGSILMQVPPNGSSVKVKTAAVTAAITGGTAIFGTGPPVKFMVLEGTGTFYPNGHPNEAMTLHGGEMVTFTADGHMVGPTTFNVKLVLETSELIVPFDELANLPLIYDVISQQQGNGPQIAFNDQTQTFDETDQAQNALPTPAPSGSPGPTGTPSKFGAPSTISSPDPYVITSGTQIQTDPSITTNGVTDFGKIYRGPATDGPFSAYAFGSTSSFDTTSGFDSQINSSGAVFKFQSLQLTGDPTVNTTNGETSLALIGVDGITSAGPGGTLTFAGIQGLLFATQNGAINLGSEISFSGTGDLNFYARGSGSNLTLASPISGFTNLRLYSGGTTQINGNESATNFSAFSGGDFLAGLAAITATNINIESLANVNLDGATLTSETLNISGAGDVNIGEGESSTTLNATSISLSAQNNLNWSGQTSDETATNSNGNVTISAGNAINIISDLDIERTNGGRTSGLNITLNAGTDLTVGGGLSLSTDASNIQNGGNIMVTSGENTTIGGSFVLRTFGLSGTATGTGGNITVNSGGDLLAGNLDFTVDYNTTDVSVNNGANLTLNVGGNLTTTQGDVDIIIYTPIAGTLTNGGNLSLSVGGDLNTAKGGNVNLTVVNTISTTVPNGANLFASIGGSLNANAVNAQIENDLSGGIGNGGNLTFNVSGDLNASSLLVQLSNTAGAHIANGGDITFHVGGDLTTGGNANFQLLNGGGTIDSDAKIDISAANVSIGGGLDVTIDNTGGSIGGNAIINFGASGNINAGDATFQILNSDNGNDSGAGTIGSAATINITTGGDFTANSLFGVINDRHPGFIGGAATVGLDVGGVLAISNDVTVGISTRNDGTGGGTIGSNATVDISAASVSVGGGFTTFVSTAAGGNVTGNASNTINVTGDLVVQGPVLVTIQDPGFNQINPVNFIAGGHIVGNATVTLSAQNITTSSTASGIPGSDIMALEASIYPNGSGTIGGDAIVNVLASQNISAPGTAFFTVANGNYQGTGGGTIGGDAKINVSAVNLSTGPLFADIYNYGGAQIGGSANIDLNLTGNLITQSNANFSIDNSNGGTIGSDATINVSATSITAGSLLAQIDNSNGGMIGTNATINSNISGNVNVTNDVTFEILGETTPAAAININGGTYDVGGTFLASIDGDGAITLNNANIRADTIKITAFGANGTLNIGGGTISADTMLKLYAAGSNGSINFVANVTLNSQSTATLIQAVSVTIVNGVIVTIAGPAPAEVFTDHPNYSSTDTSGNPTGGNDNTTGKFAGSGAHTSPFSGPTPTPSGTPSKFGPPTTIASPVPYVITNNTVIQTDPAITTNGVTDYGKIWRGADTDGPLSAFIFGSTSSFDTSSAFDILLGGGGQGGAGFKFTALQLTGDPTVSTTNGEINLALIAVNGITSGSPGGVLTFAGIRGLLLATQDGPITLGPEISFSGLHDINIYARGSSSDLTLGSDISTSNRIVLLAERDMSITSSLTTTELVYAFAGRNIALLDPAVMHAETIMLSAGQDLTWNGQISDVTVLSSVGNVDIVAGNQISIVNALEIDRRFGGGQSSGLIVSFAAGTDLIAGNGLTILLDNSGEGNMDSGVNARLAIGGNVTINGAAGLSLTIDNSNGGHIGTGGNIDVTTGGDLVATTGGLAFTIQNTSGAIDNGANITLIVGGGISSAQALSLLVANYDETANPAGHIGTGGNIFVTTGGNLTADSISVYIQNRGGGTIDSVASLTLNVSGALTTFHDGPDALGIPSSLSLVVSNRYDDTSGNTAGSSIGGDATLTLQADSASIGGNLNAIISNRGGTIGGNAFLNFNVTHDVTIQGDATWQILNNDGPEPGSNNPIGGTIHGAATLALSASSLSANSLSFAILNQNAGVSGPGGMIDSSATVIFNLSGNLTTQTDATFEIRNQYTGTGPGGIGGTGGTIGQDAVLDVIANSLSIGGVLDTSIRNARNAGDNGGNIGGNAVINLGVAGSIGAVSDSQFLNNQGGTIGSNANITLSAGSLTTSSTAADAFLVQLVNSGGRIGESASILFNVSGAISSQSDTIFQIANFDADDGNGGGRIGGDAIISVNAANISTGGALGTSIDNFGGSVGGNAIINFAATGNITAQGDAIFRIDNSNGGTIGADAAINLTATNISVVGNVNVANITANSLIAQIDNSNGGTIGGDATINMNVSGTATVSSDATVQILGSAPTGSAAINFNGGSYEVAGTFLSSIDGDGTITFSNANVHADVIKAEVFGTNGMLKIGGGSLSADSTLKLYAAGSNGSIVFTANVTLTSGTAAIIAANTVTINNNVAVTIGGSIPANVYANTRNYDAASGGNGSALYGSFAGAGATSQPFPPPGGIISATTVTGTSATNTTPVLKSSVTTTATSSLPTNTTFKSSGLAVVSAAQTSKALLSTKRFVATQNLVSSHPVATSPATSKTTINLANSAELLSLVETGSESGNKINVSKPQSRNRVPQTGAANSTSASARRGNQAAETKLETNSSSAETTTLPIHPVSSSAITNVARSASY